MVIKMYNKLSDPIDWSSQKKLYITREIRIPENINKEDVIRLIIELDEII